MNSHIKRIAVCTLVLVLAAAVEARAQQGFWGLTYMVSTPTGDTKDFTNDFSWRNIGLEGRYPVRPNVTVGLYTAWNVFHERTSRLISTELIETGQAIDVSGVQLRHLDAFPIMANVHYYFGNRRSMRPYIGANVGTYYIKHRLEIGSVAFVDDTWHFGVAPEAGIVLPTRSNVRAFLNVRYNWAAKASDRTHTYWSFGIGLAWM